MNAIANTCKRLIEKGRTTGMKEKLSQFLAFGQLTVEEYGTLMKLLESGKTAK